MELRKGQDYTRDFMEKYAKCIFPKTQDASQVTQVGNAFTEVAGFISKWSTSEGVSRVFLRLNSVSFLGPSSRDFCFKGH